MFLGVPFFYIFKDSTEMAKNYLGFERNPIISCLLEQLTRKINLKTLPDVSMFQLGHHYQEGGMLSFKVI